MNMIVFENSQISRAVTTKVLRLPMYPNTNQLKETKAYNYERQAISKTMRDKYIESYNHT